MTIEGLNQWLSANQLLLFSLLVPAISGLVALASSWFAVRRTLQSEAARRAHEAAVQISVFRQAWIDELRNSLAEFHSYGVLPGGNPARTREFYQLGTRIELLMNPNDEDYKALQDLLYKYLDASEKGTLEKYRLNPEFVEISQRILTRESDRLKQELRSPEAFVSST